MESETRNKNNYEDKEGVFQALDDVMLELDPLLLQCIEGVEMMPNNGKHLSLFLKRLIDSGTETNFASMSP